MTPTDVALVTGGASGIGRATAERLARRGVVCLADLDLERAQQVAEGIRASGGAARAYHVDVRDRAQVAAAREAIGAEVGPISLLFSNAGVARRKPVAEISLEEWATVLDTHVTGSFHVCQVVLRDMVQHRRGSVVITSSDYAVVRKQDDCAYAAAKAALYSFTKSLAVEFAPHGIRVNAIGPGPIDTPLLRAGRPAEEWARFSADRAARLPMRRLGSAEEVAAVVDLLLSPRAAYLTGQLIHPNGGQVRW